MKDLNYLSALVLKLDNEQMLFKETDKVLVKKSKEIFKKYSVGIGIHEFNMNLIGKAPTEFKSLYDSFANKKTIDGKVYGDYFQIDFDETNEKVLVYTLKSAGNIEYIHPEKAECKLFQIYSAFKSNGERAITSLVQYFEEFLSSFLYINISEKPEAYLFDKQIKYSQILENDIESIKKNILQQEIKNLMYDAISTLEKVDIINKFNLNKNEIFEKYKEIDMHRNIIVHNKGRINEEYNSKVPEKYQKELGTIVNCDEDLIDEDVLAIKKFAFLLCYLDGKNKTDLDMLEGVAFDALCNEKWAFSKYAYELLKNNKIISTEEKAIYTANYLLSCKQMDGFEKTRESIEKFDVSGMETMYLMAKDLLLENYQKVLSELEEIFNRDITAYNVECWPIFIDFRKSEEYERFVESHSSEFVDFKESIGVEDEKIESKDSVAQNDDII